MGHAEDVAAAIEHMLGLLAQGPRKKPELRAEYEGRLRVYDDAIGALRSLGLLHVGKEKTVSITDLGRHFLDHRHGLTGGDVFAEFGRARNQQGDTPSYSLPGIESVLRQIKDIPKRSTSALQGSQRNARSLRSRAAKADLRFAVTMFIAAVNAEFERRAEQPADDEWFRWPDTDAPGGDGSVGGVQFMHEGMLSRMEYRVGVRNGVATPERREILRQVFEDSLPPVFPPDYMQKWGDRGTAHRLRTLAYTIAQLTKNLKRRHDDRMDVAIQDYESDLAWLYETYYVGRFRFDWPSTSIY